MYTLSDDVLLCVLSARRALYSRGREKRRKTKKAITIETEDKLCVFEDGVYGNIETTRLRYMYLTRYRTVELAAKTVRHVRVPIIA